MEAGTEKNPKTVETGTKKPVFPEKRKKNRTGKNKEGTAKTGKTVAYDLPYTRASAEIPIKQIQNGIIYTEDGRYVKMIEVMPINFLHRSASEQRNIIYSYMGYLKIAPPELRLSPYPKKQIFPSI